MHIQAAYPVEIHCTALVEDSIRNNGLMIFLSLDEKDVQILFWIIEHDKI